MIFFTILFSCAHLSYKEPSKALPILENAERLSKDKENSSNLAQAKKLYKEACDIKSPKGCYELGMFYLDDEDPEYSAEKAKESLSLSCSGNYGDACLMLGLMYEHGVGVSASNDYSMTYYKKACKLENSEGCIEYGTFLIVRNLLDISDEARSKGIKILLHECTENNQGRGCFNIGATNAAFLQVRGAKPDKTTLVMYNVACEKEYYEGCLELGKLYMDKDMRWNKSGAEMEKDAHKLWKDSCDKGYKPSCEALDPKPVEDPRSFDEKKRDYIQCSNANMKRAARNVGIYQPRSKRDFQRIEEEIWSICGPNPEGSYTR